MTAVYRITMTCMAQRLHLIHLMHVQERYREKIKTEDLPQVDILFVVNMFLTGFDAKPLNTYTLIKTLSGIHCTGVQPYEPC